jgi:hypothetical protein
MADYANAKSTRGSNPGLFVQVANQFSQSTVDVIAAALS